MTRDTSPYFDSILLRQYAAFNVKAELVASTLPFGFDLSNPGDMLMVTCIVREAEHSARLAAKENS